jgi:hypothetical protein
MTTDDTIVSILTGVRDYNQHAPSTPFLAAQMCAVEVS